jgi:hypothetical protein
MRPKAIAPALTAAVVAVAVLAARSAAQTIPIPSPQPVTGPTPGLPPPGIEATYGPPVPEDLEQIAYNGPSYQRRHVMVRGRLGIIEAGRFLSLEQGSARVMLIVFNPSDLHDYSTLLGLDVDVRGIVRVMPGKQKTVPCRGTHLLESKCDDYLLPELPDKRIGWPETSLTVLSLSDSGTGLSSRRSEGGRTLAETGVEAAAADGKAVRAIGQFRGANLCRDLPSVSRRDPDDWVLLTPEGPLWVTDKRPAGRGFRLDPAYRADTARWLEVTGKVQILESVRYLKAGKVALIPRPAESDAVPCPP